MNLTELFIRRPVMTCLVMLTILVAGIVCYPKLPVSDLPSIDLPVIQVYVNYPGANPETMSNAIATPLERQFLTINGINTIFSSSTTGATTLVLQFDLDRDIDAAATDVQAAITTAQPLLPSNLPNNPVYKKLNPSAIPILYMAVVAPNMSPGDLYDYANSFIGQRLATVDGVAQILTFGSPYAVRIQVDPEKLAAKQIGIDEVANIISQQNVDLPVGSLVGPLTNFNIAVDGQLTKASGYSEMVIKNKNGDLVKLTDVGQALDSIDDDTYFIHYATKEKMNSCIVLGIQKLPNRNTVRIIDQINQLLDELKQQLPHSVEIHRIYDKSDPIKEAVADVELSLIIAFVLVVGLIYFSLGQWLNTLIPSLVLPLAIFGTFGLMLFFNFSIDILSLLALTLSIGFLIDDAIVVLENNVRHVELGQTPFSAAILGTREISITILSMSLCLMAGFIPLIFMEGIIGRIFREFGLTIVIAILFSGFLALTFTPMLCSRFVRAYGKKGARSKMENFAETTGEASKALYKPCLEWALHHPISMLTIGSFCVVASLFLFRAIPMDFLPPDDIGFIQGFTVARDGTSPLLMEEYHQQASKVCTHNPYIQDTLSISGTPNYNEGLFFLRLKPLKERPPIGEVINQMSQDLRNIPGLNVFLSPLPIVNFSVGNTLQALYQYSLTGFNRQSLYAASTQLIQVMKEDPIFSQVSSDLRITQPEWALKIDRDKASYYGINAYQIETFLNYAYSDNNKISQINADINQYDVLIETLPYFYRNPSVLSSLYVRSASNALVPLCELVTPSETVGPLTITHIDGFPAVGISFNPGTDVPLGTVLKRLKEVSATILPAEVQGRVIGTADIFQKSFDNITFLIIITFFVIYAILGILYESFIHPITVMSTLPPAVFGGLLTLYVTGHSLSIYSFVGLILLIGMVLKNGIMMVDFANVAVQEEKKSAYDAIVEAALIRFRPILMTSLAAGVGAIPVAIGVGGGMAANRIPLGLCIIGGLVISQFLTLLVTPVVFLLFERLQEAIFKKVQAETFKSEKQL